MPRQPKSTPAKDDVVEPEERAEETVEPEERDPKEEASAAVDEVQDANDERREVEWEGITLSVPNELPAEVLFDFADLETSESPMPMLRLLKTLVGDEAFLELRAKVAEKGSDFAVVMDCISVVADTYGISLGESSASADS
jgi:hypothetical protein